jgi:hypothetical protein
MKRACPLPPPSPQVLRQARTRVVSGHFLPSGEAGGAYGKKFWREVASGVPGRTVAQCLDGYAASHYASVANFSSSGGSRIS